MLGEHSDRLKFEASLNHTHKQYVSRLRCQPCCRDVEVQWVSSIGVADPNMARILI